MTNLLKNYFISTYLDTRKLKNNEKYPLKLRVFTKVPRKQKLYSTQFNFTIEEFKKVRSATKPSSQFFKTHLQLNEIITQAYQVADSLPSFNFTDFERLLFNNNGNPEININFYYHKAYESYRKNNQFGTASNYDLSLKSLLIFHKKNTLNFSDVTPAWLREYELFMSQNQHRSITTVGIYLRPLRAIFHAALKDKVITIDIYPFGKDKYKIPAPRSVKKALNSVELKSLWLAEADTKLKQQAKDFWFFSFFCNGMNPKDIAFLRNKDLSNDVLTFNRAKTAHTSSSQAPVIVYLNAYAKEILENNRNESRKNEDFVFPILTANASPEQHHRQLQNFIRLMNLQMNKFGEIIGINGSISFMWARHSFATSAIRKGISMERVSEALSHSSLKTTSSYFAGFTDDTKKDIATKLMDF